MRLGALLRGYAAAYGRLVTAMQEPDELAAFAPLFETLNWAVTIDDAAGTHSVPAGEPLKEGWRERIRGAGVMGGVRFARNRVHHQWAEAVVMDEGGRRYPRRYPLRYHEFPWRPIAELPRPRSSSSRLPAASSSTQDSPTSRKPRWMRTRIPRSVPEWSGIRGDVDGVLLEGGEGSDL